jgi:hypothetical protein
LGEGDGGRHRRDYITVGDEIGPIGIGYWLFANSQ